MPAHRTQNSRHLRVDAAPSLGAPPINVISPTPRTFIFSSTEPASSYSFTTHASHSLPNLFAFDASSYNGADTSSWTDAQSSTGSMFSYSDSSPTSYTGSSFASPENSFHGSSYTSSPPDTSSTPPLSLSPSPSVDGDHQLTSSSPVPYPHPLPPHSNGQVRTQPPRPPNPWICFRNVRSAQYKSTGEFPKLEKKGRGCSAPSSPAACSIGLDGEARRPRQADLSKHISLEWKALTDAEKAPYVRMSEEAKIVHARVYPGYKYQPRRKLDAGESAKKSAKAKKAGKKRSRSARRTAEAGEQFEGGAAEGGAGAGAGAVAIQLPALDIQLAPQDPAGGEQSKEWTWLPDQTLLPFTWDLDHDHGAVDDVMHQLDANIDERGESADDLFQDPFYLSFPPLENASEPLPQYFTFADSPEDFVPFADPNFTFPSSSALGLQDGLAEDTLGLSQPFASAVASCLEPELRRDALANPYPDVPRAAFDLPPGAAPAAFPALPRFLTPAGLPAAPGARGPARRGSVPAPAPAPDGLLRPPHARRARRRSVPAPAAMRAIATADFGAPGSTGITTSVLIPRSGGGGLARDLADYAAGAGLPPGAFDFEAEFGDIIDIDASRGRAAA